MSAEREMDSDREGEGGSVIYIESFEEGIVGLLDPRPTILLDLASNVVEDIFGILTGSMICAVYVW